MIRHEIKTASPATVISGSTTDMLLHVVSGSVLLCYGAPVTANDTCSPVSAGFQIIVPAGVPVAAAMVGSEGVIVTAQFGV